MQTLHCRAGVTANSLKVESSSSSSSGLRYWESRGSQLCSKCDIRISHQVHCSSIGQISCIIYGYDQLCGRELLKAERNDEASATESVGIFRAIIGSVVLDQSRYKFSYTVTVSWNSSLRCWQVGDDCCKGRNLRMEMSWGCICWECVAFTMQVTQHLHQPSTCTRITAKGKLASGLNSSHNSHYEFDNCDDIWMGFLWRYMNGVPVQIGVP